VATQPKYLHVPVRDVNTGFLGNWLLIDENRFETGYWSILQYIKAYRTMQVTLHNVYCKVCTPNINTKLFILEIKLKL